MKDQTYQLLHNFSNFVAVGDCWDAARELMATHQIIEVSETEEFILGIKKLSEIARKGDDIDRLIAIDLIVRISKFVKKLRPKSEEALRQILTDNIPPSSLLSNTKKIPEGAKPAELRENLAIALSYASGNWVVPYVVRSLLEEDRSQRCRMELARQLATREKSIDKWLLSVINFLMKGVNEKERNVEIAVTRLRDTTTALLGAARENRNNLGISGNSGVNFSKMCSLFTPNSSFAKRPKSLESCSIEVARFLDEIFANKLMLIVEPEAYSVLDIIQKWWQPLSYPQRLRNALDPIKDKILTGITLRARWGQKSDKLRSRLGQAYGDQRLAFNRLEQIATEETGLPSDIDDWLRGRRRKTSGVENATLALQSVEEDSLIDAFAPLLLEAEVVLKSRLDPSLSNENRTSLRLAENVRSLAIRHGLEVVGERDEIVEYLPVCHQTSSGEIPPDPSVKIVRPMVVRKRYDGSEDVVVKAIVTAVS